MFSALEPNERHNAAARRLTSRDLRTFQSALVAVAVAVPLALFAAASWITYLDVRRDTENSVQRTASVMHEHARKVFDTVELFVSMVDARVESLDWDQIDSPATNAILADAVQRYDQIISVWLTDPSGKVRAGSQSWDRSIDMHGRDFFDAHLGADVGLFISRPFVGKATNIQSVAVSRRRTSQRGFDGTIHVALSPEYFEQFYATLGPPAGFTASLIRADGVILARTPPTSVPVQLDLTKSPMMTRIAEGQDEALYTAVSTVDGIKRLAAHKRVAPFDVYVLVAINRQTSLEQWYQSLWLYGIVTLIACIILTAFARIAVQRLRSERTATQQLQREMQQRVAAEERLRAASKFEALGQITGGVAHDFNNLLTIIRGGVDRLSRAELTGKLQRYVGAIGTAVDRGEQLTRQLLTFSRTQPMKLTVVNPADLIRQLKIPLKSSLRGDIELRLDIPEDIWPVRVDTSQLELALINIAVNARDAMPSGGSFTLSARNSTIRTDSEGADTDCVVFEAKDTGMGIPPEVVSRIFEPFFTTKEIGKGTGLGLSQVYGFALQSGGTVHVSSEPGSGTVISLFLPRSSEEPSVTGANATPNVRIDLAKHRRILLVEDNLDVADVAKANLADLGFSVIHSQTASEALAWLSHDDAFDLVFSDIVMPGDLDGIELARALRRTHPNLPVLLTTGYSDATSAASKEGFAIVHKPFRQEQLVSALNSTIENALSAAS